MIEDFINKRFSTRNLSDEEFERILPTLAEELVDVDFLFNHSDEVLMKDWKKLCCYEPVKESSSTTRVGMKLCEQFFPNFFDIKNKKDVSFRSLWKKENLIKVLKWNRKSHSTPYLSELKRGIYFCCGLTKNTMFRPHIAKSVTSLYDGDVCLDPCAGWGGRMLGTVASGKKYIAFEPCEETYNGLVNLSNFLGLESEVTLINDVAENMPEYDLPTSDIILTSPPYFDLEVYSDEEREKKYNSYDEWKTGWWFPVIDNCLENLSDSGVSCWNVHNVGKMKMIDDLIAYHKELGYEIDQEFSLNSSKRQSNGRGKNSDLTIAFSKE